MISREELLSMLEKQGYEIIIEKKENTKYVKFNGKYSKEPYIVPHQYSDEFSDYDIKLHLVFDLFEWTGMKIQYTLTY